MGFWENCRVWVHRKLAVLSLNRHRFLIDVKKTREGVKGVGVQKEDTLTETTWGGGESTHLGHCGRSEGFSEGSPT